MSTRLQTLVSVVNQNVTTLAEQMHLENDAIIINQCKENTYHEYTYLGNRIQCYSFAEKGVGLSRTNALIRATAEICLFSDEDIIYEKGYAERVLEEFDKHPEADMLLFNMHVGEERMTYHIDSFHRVRLYNAGRYPAYAIAVRREKMHRANVTFSLLFGGGAPYSNGEDSLFLKDCLKKGLKIYAVPVNLGSETIRESTWFNGYHQKFFFDRGVLYHYLYGKLAIVMAWRFLLAHHKIMCRDIPVSQAIKLMKDGIKSQK